METAHLTRRHQTWYVRLAVPPPLQRHFGGRTEFVRTLKTRDLREANRRKYGVLAELKEMFARAAAAEVAPEDATSVAALIDAARDLHVAVSRGEWTFEEAQRSLDVSRDKLLEAARRKYGTDANGDPKLPEAHVRAIRRVEDVLESGEIVLFSDASKLYLAETSKHIRKQTLQYKQRVYDAFAAWLKDDMAASEITRKMTGRYVSEHLAKQGLAAKTVKDAIANLSALFSWLEGRSVVESNPWRGVSRTVKETTRGTKPKRRPWTDGELHALLEGIPTKDPLWPMVAIAAYSGMRREEIASLKLEDVTEKAFKVTEGKTDAALRTVPVHPAIANLVATLREQPGDGYLIPWLLRGGADEKRGHYVGKRFSRLKVRLGFKDESLNFHTLRNAFQQRCEEAEVPESTVKLLVGHERASQTYGGYSPGIGFDALARATAKVTYGKVDALVKAASAKAVEVRRSQARRHARRGQNFAAYSKRNMRGN